jgi:glycosyltransferase involved in cell wall biosynthesis
VKLLVISICKNEAATIGELIVRMPKSYPGIDDITIHVIDDGSTDDTAKIAKKHGAVVHSDGVSKGLAFRFREALDIALDLDVDVMVNIDGDLQFSPEDIPKFIAPIVKDAADFVAADRFTDPQSGLVRRPENMPLGKYLGNKLGARVIGRLAKGDFRDVTCGFRGYNRRAIEALNLNGTHTYTQESFQILAMKRLRITSLPTDVKYFKERKSRVVTSIARYVGLSTINIIRTYRDFAPLSFFFILGAIPMGIGGLCSLFVTIHWLQTGLFSPYKFIGIIGLYLVSVGIFLWGLGLVADMLVRLSATQERSLEHAKRHRRR